MASFSTACRVSARLARRTLANDVAARGFRTSVAARAAQNFTMPALSPTMTEGNIASWKVKEGDKFVAGDVLLEIETDKATMDVEAQEDGVMFKILQQDGAKQVQVGRRIAVLAEEGDDVSSLELPPDESAKPESAKEAQKTDVGSAQPETKSDSPVPVSAKESVQEKAKAAKQTKPLLPSVQALITQHGLDQAAVDEMTPTGPQNRLLKGDVLAYLGKIDAATPAAISERWAHNSVLDLSNIKVAIAEPKGAPIPEKSAKTQQTTQAPTPPSQVSVPISLDAVLAVQKRVDKTLGTFLPLSTFIARATDLANDELPLATGLKPSADELFNQVLGLDQVSKSSRGRYLPQVSAIPPASMLAPRPAQKKLDVIDLLAASPVKKASKPKSALAPGLSSGLNVFSLTVPKLEEKRAKVFLERVKLVLENDPGRLVL